MSAGRPSPAPRVRRPDIRRPVLSARAGAALGVVVILITILAIPFREWITQGARIAELESQVAWHTQRVSDLQAAHERWKDPAYVEAQARSRLHFVRPGEVGYVVLTDEQVAAPETTQTRPMADVPRAARGGARSGPRSSGLPTRRRRAPLRRPPPLSRRRATASDGRRPGARREPGSARQPGGPRGRHRPARAGRSGPCAPWRTGARAGSPTSS